MLALLLLDAFIYCDIVTEWFCTVLIMFFKSLNGPRQANLCLRAFRHDKF